MRELAELVRAVPCSGAARTARGSRPDHRDRDSLVEVQNATVGHFCQLPHCEQLRPIEGVARKAEVPDAAAPSSRQSMRMKYAGVPASRVSNTRSAGRPSTALATTLTVEVFGYFAAALQLQPIHEVEPNIVGLASA